eukprot:6208767-Pleurochrysis_carterae.AAC.3
MPIDTESQAKVGLKKPLHTHILRFALNSHGLILILRLPSSSSSDYPHPHPPALRLWAKSAVTGCAKRRLHVRILS